MPTPMDAGQLLFLLGAMTLWAATLWTWRGRGGLPVIGPANIKLTHVLPATLQVSLFAYWALWWPPVLAHLPVMAVQIVFAYAFDFLLTWSLRQPYAPTLGPVPIVLSTNLFVWFDEGNVVLYALVIAVALASKAFLRHEGRHIFNPSVLGIAVVALLCITLPSWFRYEDISHGFASPPHMAALILLLALIPQLRLRTAPVSLGAAVGMIATMLMVYALTGYRGGPSPWWPPWLLAITLLAGDPATIPSRSNARMLFGLFLGVTFYVVSRLLLFSIGTDFFSKVIPIPLANLLVPSFERAGSWLSARWPVLQRGVPGRASVAAWLSLSLLVLLLGGLR